MVQRLKTYFRRKMTFMVVPHDGGSPIQIRTNLFILHTAILLLGGVVTWAAMLMVKDINYELASINEQKLRNQMAAILTETEQNRVLLAHMSRVDQQFRKLLKLGDRKQVMIYNGVAPAEQDADDLAPVSQESAQELIDKIQASLDETSGAAKTQEASFKEITNYLSRQRSVVAATPSIWPLKGWITSGFGKRASPLTGEPGRHYGVDIANEVGSPIRVTADGLVTYAGWENGYGRVVVVEHGYGFSTRYGHCSRVDVKVGDQVKRGQVIAYVGSTGRSTGSHLHYEVRIHGIPVDPEKYLPGAID
jgi:murein DD-endopeptidase MepM/ murein hydrolase activator NlpD